MVPFPCKYLILHVTRISNLPLSALFAHFIAMRATYIEITISINCKLCNLSSRFCYFFFFSSQDIWQKWHLTQCRRCLASNLYANGQPNISIENSDICLVQFECFARFPMKMPNWMIATMTMMMIIMMCIVQHVLMKRFVILCIEIEPNSILIRPNAPLPTEIIIISEFRFLFLLSVSLHFFGR